ncbi:ATP-binding protein [Adlercreutzia sp. R25]|uniref:hybrid sensor histidine kinase/response regulator n=1 Tax=Adlercreutzia shanghongiae TaxID=3111773 RepID=UPI002DBE7E1D|nr:ATP-binding protein [Adlercreutzia sp. R25]MEC4272904.1 ATP-binding protein [Adlercreutzia sp. R25]
MGDEGRKYWLSVAAFALVFVTVVVTLSVFMQQTSNRIVAQANQYVSDATAQTSVLVSAFMENTQKDIEAIASLASESEDVTDIVTSETWLRSVEEVSPFDTIDFVDAEGVQHSVEHDSVNVADRPYFKRAMAGQSGVEAVFNTRVTHENLVYFFAPVRDGANGPVVGLLLAHYSENRLAELLTNSFFGYESQVMLCLPTGDVVASTDAAWVGRNLLEEAAVDSSDSSGARRLERAFVHHEGITFTYQTDQGPGSACLREVSGLGWMVLETFPAAATEQMISEANEGGWNTLFIIVVVFILVIAGIIAYNNRRHRSLTRSMRDREDVQRGVAKLTERLVLIDLDEERYLLMSAPAPGDGPDDASGTYSQFVERLQRRVLGDEAKEEVAKLFDKHRIIELLPPGTDNVRFEYQMNRVGVPTWEDINFICVQRDTAGHPVRLVYTTQDVSVLKQREKLLQNAMEDSYRAAVAANHAKSDFLSRMSHDIRTPMNAIIGMTELARMSEGSWDKVDACLAKITLSSNHLLALINEVLDLSMIENGRLELTVGEVDLRAQALEMETIFSQRCEERDIHFVVDADQLAHPLVEGDELRLQQVFMNMLGNAVKFTPAGGTVSLRILEHPSRVEGASDYEFVFSDTGCGMAPEFIEHVFEPFAREHDSRTEPVEGTGLGLSIALSVVSLMGGTIDVESEPGKGTTFTVRVSLRHAQAGRAGETPASDGGRAPASASAVPDLAGASVLLVEDNELNSEIAVALLESLGASAATAANGQEALEALEASEPGRFDVVLMDIQMPVMNGLEATRRIRQSEREDLRTLPVVVLSANAFTEDVQESKRAGADDHLSKPISVRDLAATLGGILGRGRGPEC